MRGMLVGTFVPLLRTLSSLLEAGRAHFRASRRDPDTLFDATLAPGMYGVGSQVRVACDHAMESMARLVGKERPRLEHGGDTLDDLAVTIATTVAFLEGVPADDFAGAAERTIRMPLREGLVMQMRGDRFVRDWALPLFYFHVVLAYAMLRHEGVEIGVENYLGHIGDAVHQT